MFIKFLFTYSVLDYIYRELKEKEDIVFNNKVFLYCKGEDIMYKIIIVFIYY